MDKLKERLKSDGWFLSEDGLQLISDSSKHDYREIVSNALNNDLRDIGEACLTAHISKQRVSQLVLQIQKIRNVSAPKSNEESQAAPRMLKLTLTDGHSTCQAIEVDHLSDLSAHKTAPGTKLLVNGARIQGGYVLLEKSCCRNLGGRVQALYEKWELGKQMLKQSRSNRTDGPPAWVNFGQKIAKVCEVSDFKSLSDKSKDSSKESSEFNVQRQDAIAEAATGAVKKVFGKGNQENVANKYNVQNDRKDADIARRNTKQNRRGRKDEDIEEKVSAKPSDKVSLFAFLEDKLPEQPLHPSNPIVNNVNASKQQTKYEKQNYHVFNKKDLDMSKSRTDNMSLPKSFTMNASRQNGDSSTTLVRRNRSGYINDTSRYPKTNNCNMETKSSNYETKRKIETNPPRRNASNKTHLETTSSVGVLTNDISRLNVNQQFVSRSLQSHLNLNRTNDYKGNQSFYNKDNYGNPFGSKYNATDKRQAGNNFGVPKFQQTYQMAPIDDFGGPKLPVQNNVIRNRNNNPQSNNTNPQQNGSNNKTEYVFSGWKVGDYCMAKYWEDSQYYNATITAVTDKTCVVQFNEYGNIEEVLNVDCIPINTDANLSGPIQNTTKPRNQRIRYFNRSKQ